MKRIVLLVLFSCSVLTAAKVGMISFQQTGALQVPKDLLSYNLQSKEGEEFTDEKLNSDIKRLYDTGYFTDVNAKTINEPDGKVDINFVLQNSPRIEKIIITGYQKYDFQKIKDQLVIHETEPMTQKLLQESVDNIRKLYHDNGYYEATVTPDTKKLSNGNVEVSIKIEENLRMKVNSVIFKGNTAFSNWTLKDAIETHHSYLNWLFEWGLYDKSMVSDDETRLRNLYWTKGYLDFAVKTDVMRLKDEADYADVIFNITEGTPYKTGKIEISGDSVIDRNELMKLVSLKSGQVYNYNEEEQSIKAIKKRFDKLGYADISCKAIRKPDFGTHIVDIIFQVEQGKSYSVLNVNISGNKIVKDYVIRRELPIQPGDPVDNSLVEAGKSRLMAMNYFEKVESYSTSTPNADMKDVNYDVKEKNTVNATIGGGFSTSDGLLGRLTLSESDFDISDPSTYFRGGGQRLNFIGQFGTQIQDVSLSFSEPWLFGIPLRLDTTGFFHRRVYDYWTERHAGAEAGLSKPISEFDTLSLGYIMDFVNISSMSDQYPQHIKDTQKGDFRKGGVKAGFQRDTRDNLFNPTSGYQLSAGAEGYPQFLGSTSNYYKVNTGANGYWSFFDKFLIAHLGANAGTMGGWVPMFDQYFLGGQNSIRGFKFRQVSPYENGRPVGGQTMLTATAEVEHPIYKWIKGAPFVDAGNAWSDPFTVNGQGVNVGVGYGIRVLIPQISQVPLKFDLGIPVYRTNTDDYSSSPQFYFDVGASW